MTNWSDSYSTSPALAGIMSDASLVNKMLAFEAALARALAQAGVAPAEAGQTIAAVCADLEDGMDLPSLFAEGARAGTLAIPLVKRLTEKVRARDASAAAWVHFGATSQDVVDSALILQLAEAIDAIEADATRLCDAAASLAQEHRHSFMLGRTLLQPATPIPFGLKAAQWLCAGAESFERLHRAASEGLVIQFGGAAGSLGSLGDKAAETARRLDALLRPNRVEAAGDGPPLPWHARRGRLAALAAELGVLTGVCGKIARDVSLMMQFEVSEATEPVAAGRGGSSAMPHKRNPVLCMFTLAAAARAPQLVATLLGALVQEHERALGGWQAEWSTVPELVKLSGGGVANMAEALAGLQVDSDRMRGNLDALRGLPMTEMVSLALASRMGRTEAHKAVETASKRCSLEGVTLREALLADPETAKNATPAELEALLEPQAAQGASQIFIDLALQQWDGRRARLAPQNG